MQATLCGVWASLQWPAADVRVVTMGSPAVGNLEFARASPFPSPPASGFVWTVRECLMELAVGSFTEFQRSYLTSSPVAILWALLMPLVCNAARECGRLMPSHSPIILQWVIYP